MSFFANLKTAWTDLVSGADLRSLEAKAIADVTHGLEYLDARLKAVEDHLNLPTLALTTSPANGLTAAATDASVSSSPAEHTA